MTKPDFVYVTYIATTPDKLWRAITDPEVTRQYWGGNDGLVRVNVSEWTAGAPWTHQRLDEAGTVDVAGTVLESTPPSRLVLSWARPAEVGDRTKHSRVTFDIAPDIEGIVKLTVTHDDLANDPKMLQGISGGWPVVLSSLKTLLETGRGIERPVRPK